MVTVTTFVLVGVESFPSSYYFSVLKVFSKFLLKCFSQFKFISLIVSNCILLANFLFSRNNFPTFS